MEKYICVTSMTQKMHDAVGTVMLQSWDKYWPKGNLIVYAEKCKVYTSNKIIVKDWDEYCYNDWSKFSQSTTNVQSVRFAKKGFVFLHALENLSSNFIIWIDADIIFHRQFPLEKLESILSNDKLIAFFDCFYQEKKNYTKEEYLDIKSRKQMAAESGFVVINTQHKNYADYVKRYRALYTASTQPPECRYWYDGEIAVESARNFMDQVIDLSQFRTTNKTQTPLNRSWMREYFTHQKGRAKETYSIEQLKKFTNL